MQFPLGSRATTNVMPCAVFHQKIILVALDQLPAGKSWMKSVNSDASWLHAPCAPVRELVEASWSRYGRTGSERISSKLRIISHVVFVFCDSAVQFIMNIKLGNTWFCIRVIRGI